MTNGPPHGVLRHLRRLAGRHGDDGVTDAQLLEQFVARRDEAAFELLVWRHQRLVLNVCRRVLRGREDAEDAFQATFLALARKAGAIGRRESLPGWLCRVAYRAALRAQSAARRAAHAPLDDLEPAAPGTCEPETAAAWRELRPLLDRELDRLPEKYRLPVVLCYLEGKTYAEAARQLGWSGGTLSTRLARARQLLRRRLARHGLGVSAAALAATLAEQAASADMPAGLVGITVRAARTFAEGTGSTAGEVPARVAALAEGVLRTMMWTKLKTVATVAVAVGVIVSGAGLFAGPGLGARPPAPEDPPPAAGEPDPAPAETDQAPPGERRPEAGPSPLDRCLAGWEKAFTKTDTLVAEVSRTETSETFQVSKVFAGTFKYRKPGGFILEMSQKDEPENFEKIVVSGSTLYQYVPGRKEIRQLHLPPARPGQIADDNFLSFLFGMKAEEAKRRYDLKLIKEDQYYAYVGINPRLDADKADFRTARLVLLKETLLPRQLWFEPAHGHTVTWDVLRIRRDVPLLEKEFTAPRVPPGWRLIELPARGADSDEPSRHDTLPPPDPPQR
jgi:TIGR03009 family protein